jgi:threonyl-tRNA synthetase
VDPGEKTITRPILRGYEDKMLELAREEAAFVRRDVSKDEAMKTYTEKGDQYKL